VKHRIRTEADVAAAREFIRAHSDFDLDAFEQTPLAELYAQPLGPTPACCSIDEITAWFETPDGTKPLTKVRRSEIEQHLTTCDVCPENLQVYRSHLGLVPVEPVAAAEGQPEVTVRILEPAVFTESGAKEELVEMVLMAEAEEEAMALLDLESLELVSDEVVLIEPTLELTESGLEPGEGHPYVKMYAAKFKLQPVKPAARSRKKAARRAIVRLLDDYFQVKNVKGQAFQILRPTRLLGEP
jgi:hypothetical protein